MKKRQLGKDGPIVSALGIGCMGMVEFYGTTNDTLALQTLERAVGLGINFVDTADIYGRGRSENLISLIKGVSRDQLIISTKFGFIRPSADIADMYLDGSPQYVKKACEQSLQRLNTDYIDVYMLHRVDPNIPVEDTVGAMKQLVEEGKVRYIGLSDTTVEILKRASAIHPIHVYQGEYSLWHRIVENDLLPFCIKSGISFIPYSPLGRGFLAGSIRSFENIEDNDFRKILPRFQPDNLEKNLLRLNRLKLIAEKKNCSLPQLALAWLLAQDISIIPIPGAKTPQQIEDDYGSINVIFSDEELLKIDEIMPLGCAAGAPYPEKMTTT